MKKNSNLSLFNPLVSGALLFFILIFVAFYPYMSYDEGLWSYIGGIWSRNGLAPYASSVENKTPGIFMLFAIAEYISTGNFVFVRILGAISVVISSIFIYKIVEKAHSKFAGQLSMYIFGFASCWYILDGYALAQTETFMVLFSVMAFYILTIAKSHQNFKKMMFFVGIALGLAISFKQIAITTSAAFFCFYLIFTSQNKSNVLKFHGLCLVASGFLFTLLFLYFILFIFGVSIIDYVDGAWLILFNPGSMAPDFDSRLIKFSRIFLFSRFIIFYPILIYIIFKYKSFKSKFFIGILIWLIIDFIGVNASGYYYGHQIKQLLAPLSIISGIVLATLCENGFFDKKFHVKKSSVIILTIIFFFPIKQIYRTGKELSEKKTAIYEELGLWLNKNTSKNDYIYVLGSDGDLVRAFTYSGRLSSSKYFHSIFITSELQREVVYKDLKMKLPVFILKEINFPTYKNQYGRKTVQLIQDNYSFFRQVNNFEILKRNNY